ncbi:class E sortase [Microlunatus elymi]|uniref:class E sortase n=1 Tax=Microlunatus elymi TaxID=2596828 RepID=UPI001D17F5C0|nr:class E sortase [Microlunatus elymi]
MSSPADPTTPSRRDRPRRRGSRILTVVGVLLIAFGVGVLGYVGYQLYGTNITSRHAYDSEREQLKRQWQQPATSADPQQGGTSKKDTVIPGDAIALLSIPAIGLHEIPVLEGTSDDVLARGIGHYSQTADPGQVGNFAVAGHRITHGEPFSKLLELNRGDQVVVETRTKIYTYAIDNAPKKLTVTDTDSWVLDPVPGKPNAEPTKKLITLTTCQDLFHSPDRSVGFGHLIDSRKKS